MDYGELHLALRDKKAMNYLQATWEEPPDRPSDPSVTSDITTITFQKTQWMIDCDETLKQSMKS